MKKELKEKLENLMCTTNHQSTNEYGKLYSEVVVLGFMEMAYVMAKSEDAERIKELEAAQGHWFEQYTLLKQEIADKQSIIDMYDADEYDRQQQ